MVPGQRENTCVPTDSRPSARCRVVMPRQPPCAPWPIGLALAGVRTAVMAGAVRDGRRGRRPGLGPARPGGPQGRVGADGRPRLSWAGCQADADGCLATQARPPCSPSRGPLWTTLWPEPTHVPGGGGEGGACLRTMVAAQHRVLLAPGRRPARNGLPLQSNVLVSARPPAHQRRGRRWGRRRGRRRRLGHAAAGVRSASNAVGALPGMRRSSWRTPGGRAPRCWHRARGAPSACHRLRARAWAAAWAPAGRAALGGVCAVGGAPAALRAGEARACSDVDALRAAPRGRRRGNRRRRRRRARPPRCAALIVKVAGTLARDEHATASAAAHVGAFAALLGGLRASASGAPWPTIAIARRTSKRAVGRDDPSPSPSPRAARVPRQLWQATGKGSGGRGRGEQGVGLLRRVPRCRRHLAPPARVCCQAGSALHVRHSGVPFVRTPNASCKL